MVVCVLLQAAAAVLGRYAWATFGWRLYSRLECDLRRKDAEQCRKALCQMDLFGALAKLDGQVGRVRAGGGCLAADAAKQTVSMSCMSKDSWCCTDPISSITPPRTTCSPQLPPTCYHFMLPCAAAGAVVPGVPQQRHQPFWLQQHPGSHGGSCSRPANYGSLASGCPTGCQAAAASLGTGSGVLCTIVLCHAPPHHLCRSGQRTLQAGRLQL